MSSSAILIILVFFTHRFPIESKEEEIKSSYFKAYVKSHSKEYLNDRFNEEINNGNSVVNDYLIANWLIENDGCARLETLKAKYLKYKKKNTNMSVEADVWQEVDIDETQWLPVLESSIKILDESCN